MCHLVSKSLCFPGRPRKVIEVENVVVIVDVVVDVVVIVEVVVDVVVDVVMIVDVVVDVVVIVDVVVDVVVIVDVVVDVVVVRTRYSCPGARSDTDFVYFITESQGSGLGLVDST